MTKSKKGAEGRLKRRKAAMLELKFGSSIQQLVRKQLKDRNLSKMTVARTALDQLEDQASFLGERIVHAATQARTAIFKTQTMSAPAIKAGIGLSLPEDIAERAVQAGEAAVKRLVSTV